MKTFEELWNELSTKAASQDPISSTVKLIDSGVHSIGKKIVEEAAEVWMAAEHEGNEALALEISQLIYHLQVLAISQGLDLKDIYKEL
jgi:phosphoribosyl-ATP pyrophosphohydrolase